MVSLVTCSWFLHSQYFQAPSHSSIALSPVLIIIISSALAVITSIVFRIVNNIIITGDFDVQTKWKIA